MYRRSSAGSCMKGKMCLRGRGLASSVLASSVHGTLDSVRALGSGVRRPFLGRRGSRMLRCGTATPFLLGRSRLGGRSPSVLSTASSTSTMRRALFPSTLRERRSMAEAVRSAMPVQAVSSSRAREQSVFPGRLCACDEANDTAKKGRRVRDVFATISKICEQWPKTGHATDRG